MDGPTADYVIVGAGSAGCVLAARLSADPAVTVLLLEAGGPDRHPWIHVPAAFSRLFRTRYDWNYTTERVPGLGGRQLYWPRGKVLGGSSSLNAQIYVRGHRLDYDGWAARGNPGWAFADVLPYFLRLEGFAAGPAPLRGTHGPRHIEVLPHPNPTTRAFLQAAVAAGLPPNDDVNGPDQDGVGLVQVTQRGGRRWSVVRAYLAPARRRRNLRVLTGAHVTRLVLDGDRAVGVEYVRQGGEYRAHAGREVVLAAGAVNSPQLLLLSGIGPAAHLRALGIRPRVDLPGVGQHLQDHPAVAVVVSCRLPVTLAGADSWRELGRYVLFRRGLLASSVGEAVAFVRTRPELPAPDLELIFAPGPYVDHGTVRLGCHALTLGVVLLQPRSRGTLRLASRDPFAPPRIQPDYLADPEDLRVLVAGVRLARRLFRTPPLGEHVGTDLEPIAAVRTDDALAAFVREQAETLYHPVGTCRMGTDEQAVVDPELRVRGVAGLRVADASVIPQIPRGHTEAAVLLVAERAADLLLGRPAAPLPEAASLPAPSGPS